jgi:hypothetical protein
MQTEEISKVVAVISRGGVFWVFFFFGGADFSYEAQIQDSRHQVSYSECYLNLHCGAAMT